jgi:hypothetical protein
LSLLQNGIDLTTLFDWHIIVFEKTYVVFKRRDGMKIENFGGEHEE